MIAWTAARMDPGVYGERIAFHFPNDTGTDGPALVESRIDQDDAISAQFSLWDRSGSSVIRGNLLVLPIGEDGLLYVEPIFLQASGAPFPQFVRVIMVSNEAGRLCRERARCHRAGAGRRPAAASRRRRRAPGGRGRPGGGSAAALLEAQAALAAGDLGTYQDRLNELAPVLERLAELTGASRARTQRLAVARGDPGPRLRGARARPGLAAGPGRRSRGVRIAPGNAGTAAVADQFPTSTRSTRRWRATPRGSATTWS